MKLKLTIGQVHYEGVEFEFELDKDLMQMLAKSEIINKIFKNDGKQVIEKIEK